MDTPQHDRVPPPQVRPDFTRAAKVEGDPQISAFFTWREVTDSVTADRLALDNTPPPDLRHVLRFTAQRMDRVRRLLGAPVIVTSWYRSLALNRALASKDSSQHITGQAVDFRCPGYGTPQQVFDFLRPLVTDLEADQLILEYPNRPRPWVHISFVHNGARLQALVIDDSGVQAA